MEFVLSCINISIHAPREGSDLNVDLFSVKRHGISIHAPREGSDWSRSSVRPAMRDFYPRSPRGERLCGGVVHNVDNSFLSTLPARGATFTWSKFIKFCREFLSTLPARGATCVFLLGALICEISIHAPREGSDELRKRSPSLYRISIHAPREGSDVRRQSLLPQDRGFLSTLPARGATKDAAADELAISISIHAPREGSDGAKVAKQTEKQNFYPRSPRGERPNITEKRLCGQIFLSTLPARGATHAQHLLLLA